MKNLMQVLLETGRDHGWASDTDGERFTLERPRSGDGYPHRVSGVVWADRLESGLIWNDYGSGEECFKAGQRYLLAVLQNVDHPLRYKTFYDAFLQGQPSERSEKSMAKMASDKYVNVSERQIRKARMCGFMDAYMADRLCTLLLSRHPSELYGAADWVSGVEFSETP